MIDIKLNNFDGCIDRIMYLDINKYASLHISPLTIGSQLGNRPASQPASKQEHSSKEFRYTSESE